jgi:hypothetical protein
MLAAFDARFVGPLCPLIDPRPHQPHLLRGERLPFPFRGHHQFRIVPRNCEHEPAFLTLAGHDHLAIVAARQRGRFHLEVQPRLLHLDPMTVRTPGQKWLDILDEIDGARRRSGQLYLRGFVVRESAVRQGRSECRRDDQR